jgi:hypothetical protein
MSVPLQNLRPVWLSVAVIAGAMFMVGVAVNALYPDDWRAVEATVRSSRVADVSSRSPDWVLRVDVTFEVSGRSYQATTSVFRDPERSVSEAEASKWPVGRRFTLYSDASHPQRVSLAGDGGRQATVVTAVILTPLVVLTTGFIVFLFRRKRTNHVNPTR